MFNTFLKVKKKMKHTYEVMIPVFVVKLVPQLVASVVQKLV